jgi:hypothetical protein
MPIEKFDEKTKVVTYECEECETEYATEDEALSCEETDKEEEHRH